MRTKGANGALLEIGGSVVGARPGVRSRIVSIGVVVAVAVGIAVSVASFPTTVTISSSSTYFASSFGIGGGANFGDELPILIQKFINLRLLLVNLGLLFSDHLQQIIVLRRHLLDMLFVGS